MGFKKGEKFVVTSNMSEHGFRIGETIVFTGEYDVEYDIYKMDNGTYWQWMNISEFKTKNEQETKYLIAKVNFEGFISDGKGKQTQYFKCLFTDLKRGDIVIVDSAGIERHANFLGYASENRIKTKPTKHVLRKSSTHEKFSIEEAKVEKVNKTYPFREDEELVIVKKTSLYNSLSIGEVVTFVRIHKDGDLVVKDSKNCIRFLKRDEVEKMFPSYDRDNEMNLDFHLSDETEELMQVVMEFHKAQYIDKCLDDRDFEAIKKVI